MQVKSTETVPLMASEHLRKGIHQEIRELIESRREVSQKYLNERRNGIAESIDFLEKNGTACTVNHLRRRLKTLDERIAELQLNPTGD